MSKDKNPPCRGDYDSVKEYEAAIEIWEKELKVGIPQREGYASFKEYDEAIDKFTVSVSFVPHGEYRDVEIAD